MTETTKDSEQIIADLTVERTDRKLEAVSGNDAIAKGESKEQTEDSPEKQAIQQPQLAKNPFTAISKSSDLQ